MEWFDFVDPALLVLIPVLYFIGIMIKKGELISDKFIPVCDGIVGVLLATIWILATKDFGGRKEIFTAVFTAIVQGVICAGLSVYTNQLIKQMKKD